MASGAAEEQVDASDPTKIYTYVGIGPKYTDYSNAESMLELRVSGNPGLSRRDMVLYELGYGQAVTCSTSDAGPHVFMGGDHRATSGCRHE